MKNLMTIIETSIIIRGFVWKMIRYTLYLNLRKLNELLHFMSEK